MRSAGHALGGPALVAATGVALCALTWRGWADPVVDFGRELYVPWRLSEGEALFRDIAWFNGPLSQHFNALLFELFGPGASVLFAANLAILAVAAALSYALVARIAGRLAATVGGVLFLGVFAFGQYVGLANYNWAAPYSHEVTHGLTLALAALFAADAWARRGHLAYAAGAGLAVGLAFLTKVEPFLAAAGASAVVLARRDARALLAAAGAALVPVLVSLALVGRAGTLGAWPSVLAGDVAELPFYRAGMGLDDPAGRLADALVWAAGWAAFVAPVAALAAVARRGREVRWVALGAALLVVTILVALRGDIAWTHALKPLPLFTAGTCGWLAWHLWRDRARRRRWATALGLGVLSLAMLGKMILNARVAHYGFALALPGTLLLVAVLVGWLPAWIGARGGQGAILRAGVLALLGYGALEHVGVTRSWMERKTAVVGEGRDALRADARGPLVNDALAAVRGSNARTLAALPEGVMLNYLARLPNPTPYINFMPPEELLFGEAAWLAAFRAAPPDVILVLPKNTDEYGRGAFGRGYGAELAAWVEATYRPVTVVVRPPTPFEIRILARGKAP